MQNGRIEKEKIHELFRQDKVVLNLLLKYGIPEPGVRLDVFNALIRSIIGQQLSIKAAKTIYERFRDLFETEPEPGSILDVPQESLRAVGLSTQKAGYVHNVSRFFNEKDLTQLDWKKLSDQQVIDLLTQIKGVGVWTVQMLLMFTLERNDVFPVDDLGIQQGMKHLYGLETEGKVLKEQLIKIADNWRPYRSVGSKLIWTGKDAQ